MKFMRKSILFFILLLVIIALFLGAFGLYEIKYFTAKADISQATFSIDNSYIFSTPYQARANGQEKIRLTVFILNNQGLGVLGKKISITSDNPLNIEAIQEVSDNYGKAYFDISTISPGEYNLNIKADDIGLNQKAHLIFN